MQTQYNIRFGLTQVTGRRLVPCTTSAWVIVICSVLNLSGQDTTGAIRGGVTDSSGAVIVGSTVTIASNETGVTQSTKTGSAGAYSFLHLPPGSYRATAEANGFQKMVRDNILVLITETAVVNFNLQVGSASESVTVDSGISLLQTDSSREARDPREDHCWFALVHAQLYSTARAHCRRGDSAL